MWRLTRDEPFVAGAGFTSTVVEYCPVEFHGRGGRASSKDSGEGKGPLSCRLFDYEKQTSRCRLRAHYLLRWEAIGCQCVTAREEAHGHVRPPKSIFKHRNLAREQRVHVDLKLGVDIRGNARLYLRVRTLHEGIIVFGPKNHRQDLLRLMPNSRTSR
jgi:hypothetical protein